MQWAPCLSKQYGEIDRTPPLGLRKSGMDNVFSFGLELPAAQDNVETEAATQKQKACSKPKVSRLIYEGCIKQSNNWWWHKGAIV